MLTTPLAGDSTMQIGAHWFAKASNSGNNLDAVNGKQVHKEFRDKVLQKDGWVSEPRIYDPITGRYVKPDAVTRSGRPIELKPNTPSGHAQGARQLKKYERVVGKKGRIIYYNPSPSGRTKVK